MYDVLNNFFTINDGWLINPDINVAIKAFWVWQVATSKCLNAWRVDSSAKRTDACKLAAVMPEVPCDTVGLATVCEIVLILELAHCVPFSQCATIKTAVRKRSPPLLGPAMYINWLWVNKNFFIKDLYVSPYLAEAATRITMRLEGYFFTTIRSGLLRYVMFTSKYSTPLGQNICILFYFQAFCKFLGL